MWGYTRVCYSIRIDIAPEIIQSAEGRAVDELVFGYVPLDAM